jgi:hypothetical protein
MDTWILYAIDALFIVAVAAPPILVTFYRWREVPLRRGEIENMMKIAFENPNEAASMAAREALANNPYISDPYQTFDRYHNPGRYVLPLLMLIVLTVSSAFVAYAWVRYRLAPPATASSNFGSTATLPTPASASAQTSTVESPASSLHDFGPKSVSPALPIPTPIPARLPLVFIMALAGGYTWSVYQIVARIRASELLPVDLYEIDFGLLASVPVGIAFSLITAELEGVRSFMAFAASAFPLRDVSLLIRQYATRKMLGSSDASAARLAGPSSTRPTERHLGTAIEGLSDETLARLSEIRITTILDMAYSDPIKIMVQTGFPLPVIIDWMDQSIWALYVGDLKAEINRWGIRCSLDVCEFVDLHLLEGGEKKKEIAESAKLALEALSQTMSVPTGALQDLFFRIYADPQVVILRKLWYPRGTPKKLQA